MELKTMIIFFIYLLLLAQQMGKGKAGHRVPPDCYEGYQYVGDSCSDVDECKNRAGTCETDWKCFNTFGSYKCTPVEMCVDPFYKNESVCIRNETFPCQESDKLCAAKINTIEYVFLSIEGGEKPDNKKSLIEWNEIPIRNGSQFKIATYFRNATLGASGVKKASAEDFRVDKSGRKLYQENLIYGPQRIELQMNITYRENQIITNVDTLYATIFVGHKRSYKLESEK